MYIYNEKKIDIFLILTKLFFALYLLYYGWFQMVFFQIPNMTSVLGAVFIFFIFLHAMTNKKNLVTGITSELLIWIFFTLYILGTGLLVAEDSTLLMTTTITFIQYLILIFGMSYVTFQSNKIDYFINIYIFFAVISAITTLLWGYEYSSTRLTMSESTNPNTLGLIMVIGLFCVLFNLNFNRIKYSIFNLSIGFLFIYIIIMTGSRKNILSAFILILLWFLFIRKDSFIIFSR